jgi:NADPH-dependent 2,4-dienoyl-CoA reductase/sulfur reductase-like enzyme/rhodanese-related sulfurtransferase
MHSFKAYIETGDKFMKKQRSKVIVVGGVAGGMSFATRYRRLNQDDEIIIFEKGPYVSFANCGLPYHISGEISTRSGLLVVRETLLKERFHLDIRSNAEVVAIDSTNKKISYVKDGNSFEESYDKLVLSTGAKPIVIDIKGQSNVPVFTLRNIPDLDKIMRFIKDNKPTHATVIGAGYIGLEVAENLTLKGIQTTIIEKASEVLPIVDPEMAAFVKEELIEKNVTVFTGNEISMVEGKEVVLASGDHFQTDFIVMAVGVLPDSALAKQTGIQTGLRGGIQVNHQYETSIKDVYAIGDAILVTNQVSNQETLIPLASPANRQGRQLADILSGLNVTNKGSLGTSIVKVFDLSLAATGLNERQLAGKHFQALHLTANDHASYYPNATSIYLKVIYDPTTELILGAQAVGKKGVDKRIDILSTAIKAKLKVTFLQELEFTYAPPFGSAKDIVNMAGYVASNQLLGITKVIQWHQAIEWMKDDSVVFIDVRSFFESQAQGSLPNAIVVDLDQIKDDYTMIPKDKKVVVFCDNGIRGYNAEQFLRNAGYDVYNLDGGYNYISKMFKETAHV